MSQIANLLQDEHRSNLALLGRVENALVRAPRGAKARSDELLGLMRELLHQTEHDVDRHFAFEESELFERMEDRGEGDIVGLLRQEHDAIRDVVAELVPLVKRSLDSTLDDAGWNALRTAALELVERQVSHIQKEEMSLLPMLEDMLDDEADRQLAMDYVS